MSRAADESIPEMGESRPTTLRSWVIGSVSIALTVIAVPLLYLSAYGHAPVHAIGWDSYGYMWQSRIVGLDPLGQVGTRLGVPVVGSLTEHVLGVDPSVEPVVLGLAMTIGLAIGVAALVRSAFHLPAWSVPVIALTVGWWGGTARLAAGYQANLLSLLLFTGAISVFLWSRGRTSMLLLGGFMILACGLTHPGFMPVYVAIALGWVVVSRRQRRLDAEAGRSLLRTEPVAALLASTVSLAVAAVVIFVLLHHSRREVVDLSVVSALFRDRLARLPTQLGAISTVPLTLAGLVVGYRIRRRREARLLSGLAIVWIAACLAGLLLGIVDPSFPAHRAVLFATPVAVLMGLGVAGAGGSIAGFGAPGSLARRASGIAAVIVVAAAIAAVAWTGHRTYTDLAESTRGYIDDPTLRTAAYLATVKPTVPIIVVTNRPDLQGLVFAKLYFNATRAYAPTETIPHIFTYLGNPAQLLARGPAQIPDPTEDWMLGYNQVSLQAWPDVRRAFDRGAIILYNEEQVSSALWETAVPDNPSHQVSPGLFIVRGPLTAPAATVAAAPPNVSRSRVAVQVLLTLLMLVVVGGGFSCVCAATGDRSRLDTILLAPAVGAALVVVTGLVTAAVRVVPGSPGGVALIAAGAACGYGWAIAPRATSSRAASTRSTSSTA